MNGRPRFPRLAQTPAPWYEEPPTPLAAYAQVLRRQAWLIVLVFALTVGVAYGATTLQERTYRASLTLVVGQAGGEFQPVIGNTALTQTMTTLIKSELVLSDAIKRLNLDTTPERLAKKLKVNVEPGSSVLQLSLERPDAAGAEKILDEVAATFIRITSEKLGIQPKAALGQPSPSNVIFATVFNPAHADPRPVSPRRGTVLVFASVLGLLIGGIMAFARDRLDDRIRGRRDAEQSFGAPVIGALPPSRRHARPRTDGNGAGGALRSDGALQLLSLNLDSLQYGSSVVVTSTRSGEGKTGVVADLAFVLTQFGKDVICVETDSSPPRLGDYFRLTREAPGLVDVVQGRAELDSALQTVWTEGGGANNGLLATGAESQQGGRLRVVTLGEPISEIGTIIAHGNVTRLAKALRAKADYVIFDASPLDSGHALRLIRELDNVVVVARQGSTTRSRAEETRLMLEQLGVAKVGIVLTNASAREAYA